MSSNLIAGTAVNDVLRGVVGKKNTIYGYSGNDMIYGAELDDIIYAGDWDDVIDAGKGKNIIDGGNGNDVAIIRANITASNFSIKDNTITVTSGAVGTAAYQQHVMTNIETIRTISTSNVTTNYNFQTELKKFYDQKYFVGKYVYFNTATEGSDWIGGSSGNDRLQGDAGVDVFYGGAGNDDIFGGGGTTDNAYFDGLLSNYRISKGYNGVVILVSDINGTTIHTMASSMMSYAGLPHGYSTRQGNRSI